MTRSRTPMSIIRGSHWIANISEKKYDLEYKKVKAKLTVDIGSLTSEKH